MHTCDGVGHAGAQILSLDVHKDGTRFVTSASDNKTRVWNLLVALDPTQEEDEGKPRLLATLTDHFEGVNAARFSRSVTFSARCCASCMHVSPGVQGSAPSARSTKRDAD